MDVSLDDYIQRRKGGKGSVAQRLGVKKIPIVKKGKQQSTSFKVTGLGKVKSFDARQKLSNKPTYVADARANITRKKKFVAQKITAPGEQDARAKITQKTKFVDARVRIENKKTQAGQDLRVKVNNMQAKKTDARSKINIKRQQNPQITVTGLGSVNKKIQGGVKVAVGGGLTKKIRTAPGSARTAPGSADTKPQNKGIRVSGSNLVITRNNRPESTDVNSLPGNARAPIIKIKNDHYRPPDTAKQIPVRTTARVDQNLFSRAIADTLVQQHAKQPEPVYTPEPTYHAPAPPQQPTTVVQYQYVPVIEPAYTQPYVTEQSQRHAYINPDFTKMGDRLGQKVATPPKQAPSSPSTYRVMITSLHPIVSQDDIVELFGAVGALKRARILKAGTAEVIYLHKDDAVQACRKYHNRELDGQPMQVHMTSHTVARKPPPVKKSPSPPPVERASTPPRHSPPPRPRRSPTPPRRRSSDSDKAETMETEHEPLRLGKDAPPTKLANVDMGMIHKALFKTKGSGPSKPVTFTVKI